MEGIFKDIILLGMIAGVFASFGLFLWLIQKEWKDDNGSRGEK